MRPASCCCANIVLVCLNHRSLSCAVKTKDEALAVSQYEETVSRRAASKLQPPPLPSRYKRVISRAEKREEGIEDEGEGAKDAKRC